MAMCKQKFFRAKSTQQSALTKKNGNGWWTPHPPSPPHPPHKDGDGRWWAPIMVVPNLVMDLTSVMKPPKRTKQGKMPGFKFI